MVKDLFKYREILGIDDFNSFLKINGEHIRASILHSIVNKTYNEDFKYKNSVDKYVMNCFVNEIINKIESNDISIVNEWVKNKENFYNADKEILALIKYVAYHNPKFILIDPIITKKYLF